MTQDEIIDRGEVLKMAKQAGLAIWHKDLKKWQLEYGVEAFAKLVDAKATAKERERASKAASKAILNAVENEREACAKVCDALESKDADFDSHHWNQATQRCGYAIRARGEPTSRGEA